MKRYIWVIRNFLLLLMPFSLMSCVTALPVAEPEETILQSLKAADSASLRSKDYANECRMKLDESERLLEEARSLLRNSIEAKQACADMVAKIPKPRKRKKRKKTTSNEGEIDKSNQKWPEWSPSDAPPGMRK